jgi:hypothetical protein
MGQLHASQSGVTVGKILKKSRLDAETRREHGEGYRDFGPSGEVAAARSVAKESQFESATRIALVPEPTP